MTYLVPRAGAIVRVDGGRAHVEAREWSASFEGELAADVALMATGTVSPRLEALAKTNAAAAALVSWRDQPWTPLTALDAIRLDGFDTFFLELLGTCNERCVHCYAESSPQVRAGLEREVCEAIVDDAYTAGFRRIQLTGGDPLLCKFLPELVERAAPKFEVREIYTNGLLLDERLLDRLAPHGPAFAFSYYSHDPAIHDAITRTPGSHKRTRAAIERAATRGLAVRAAVVVLNDNVDTVDQTIADLQALGVTSISTSAMKSAGRGSAFGWQPKPSSNTNAGHRSAGAQSDGKLAVTYDGLVVPCIFNRSRVLGRVDRTTRLRDVLGALATTHHAAATADTLSCTSCRITDLALASLGAAR